MKPTPSPVAPTTESVSTSNDRPRDSSRQCYAESVCDLSFQQWKSKRLFSDSEIFNRHSHTSSVACLKKPGLFMHLPVSDLTHGSGVLLLTGMILVLAHADRMMPVLQTNQGIVVLIRPANFVREQLRAFMTTSFLAPKHSDFDNELRCCDESS